MRQRVRDVLDESSGTNTETAHSLAWTLALLAAYPEIQDQAFQEIVENWPQPSAPTDGQFQGRFSTPTTIADYADFPFILACYSETLRLFPPVQQIPKVATEDMRIFLEKDNSQPVSSSILNGTAKFDGPTPYSRASGRVSPVLSAQRELIVKKGTVVFVDSPAVREYPRISNSTTPAHVGIQIITLAIGRTLNVSTQSDL